MTDLTRKPTLKRTRPTITTAPSSAPPAAATNLGAPEDQIITYPYSSLSPSTPPSTTLTVTTKSGQGLITSSYNPSSFAAWSVATPTPAAATFTHASPTNHQGSKNPHRHPPSPRGISGPSSSSEKRLSSLAAFVSAKTQRLSHRASLSFSNTSNTALAHPLLAPDHQEEAPAVKRSHDQLLQPAASDSLDSPTSPALPLHEDINPSPTSPQLPLSPSIIVSPAPVFVSAPTRQGNATTSRGPAPTTSTILAARSRFSIGVPTPFGDKASPGKPDITQLKKSKTTSTESLLGSSEEQSKLSKLLSPGNDTSVSAQKPENKMHQTSSRLLRMTDDDRPFTRDFKDLFSTLIVSLPLTTHRIRFKSYPFSFTSEEAINNLGSLKFSQSNRMPDPKDPSRIVTTTTTTTFSMAKEMARSVCQRFMDARFIELADGKTIPVFPLKGCLWQLTPKGIHILERFCQRNGIQQEHVLKLLQSPYNTMRLVILERDVKSDKLSHDKTTTEVIFRRFAGHTPNIKANSTISDNDSVSEYQDGITGVKLAETRKIYDKVIKNSFTGKCAVDWLLDCCTTVERAETHEIVSLFVMHGLIQSVLEDKVYIQQNPRAKDFQPTKNAIYIFTEKGKRVAGWIEPERMSLGERSGDGSRGTSQVRDHPPRDNRERETNTTRLTTILNDPALRLLYREFLRETVCEENLAFYLDVVEFNKNFNAINLSKSDAVRETLAAAYGLYNAFLAPGSPCELNIDSTLRQDMASRMTRAVAKDDASMYQSLKEVAALFDRAQSQVFKLMAGDSVPKFIRTHKYLEVVGDMLDDERTSYNHSGITRSASRSAAKANGAEHR